LDDVRGLVDRGIVDRGIVGAIERRVSGSGWGRIVAVPVVMCEQPAIPAIRTTAAVTVRTWIPIRQR
jgi:hypothetical protein